MQTNSLCTYSIYHDEVLQAEFTGQKNDEKTFGYILKHQSASVHHALRYEGWKVIVTNELTGVKTNYALQN